MARFRCQRIIYSSLLLGAHVLIVMGALQIYIDIDDDGDDDDYDDDCRQGSL